MSKDTFLTVPHYTDVTATLADFKNEETRIRLTYDDVEDGTVIYVQRAHRRDDNGYCILTKHLVNRHNAHAKFARMVAAAVQCAPAFIPCEW